MKKYVQHGARQSYGTATAHPAESYHEMFDFIASNASAMKKSYRAGDLEETRMLLKEIQQIARLLNQRLEE